MLTRSILAAALTLAGCYADILLLDPVDPYSSVQMTDPSRFYPDAFAIGHSQFEYFGSGFTISTYPVIGGNVATVTGYEQAGFGGIIDAGDGTVGNILHVNITFGAPSVGFDWRGEANMTNGNLGLCSDFGGCNSVANGTEQTVGIITWSDGSTDTIRARADYDPPTTVPEPGSWLLLLGVLTAVAPLVRKRVSLKAEPFL